MPETQPELVVVGAGAMGLLYAGLLAPHSSVTVLDGWRAQIDALQSQGLTLTGVGGVKRPPVRAVHLRDVAALRSSADIVIALTGAAGSREAAEAAAVVLRPEGYLLTLQNGVGNIEAYEAALGPGRVLAGLSYHSAALGQPATAEHTHKGPTWIGEIDRSKTERLERADCADGTGRLRAAACRRRRQLCRGPSSSTTAPSTRCARSRA